MSYLPTRSRGSRWFCFYIDVKKRQEVLIKGSSIKVSARLPLQRRHQFATLHKRLEAPFQLLLGPGSDAAELGSITVLPYRQTCCQHEPPAHYKHPWCSSEECCFLPRPWLLFQQGVPLLHLILVPVAQTNALNGLSLKHKEASREKER